MLIMNRIEFLNFLFYTDCSGCINGSYGCSSDCFAYDCNGSNCDFVDLDRFCEKNGSSGHDRTARVNIDDHENHAYSDICAYSSS